MLSQSQPISYDPVIEKIHYYFSTRTTTDSHKDVMVSFYGGIYRLHNAHCPEKGLYGNGSKGVMDLLGGERDTFCTSTNYRALVTLAKLRLN